MPNSDGSVPAGTGKKTGKGLGPCVGDPVETPARGRNHGSRKGHGHGNKSVAVSSPNDSKNTKENKVKQP